jgi:hypothetical protein
MLNLNVMGQMSGSAKQVASASNVFKSVPGLAIVKIGDTAELKGYVDGTIKVNYLFNNGTMGDTVPTNQYTIVADSGAFTAPAEAPEAAVDRVIVRYDRDATSGVAVHNRADKFPKTIRLILKVLIVDPCDASQLRAAYIDVPSFQPSPELSLTFSSEGTIDKTTYLLVA